MDRTRRKAVWGPKRTLVAALVVCMGLAPGASAAGRHSRPGKKALSGGPNYRAKNYKLDDELTRRSRGGHGGDTTPVIVTLVPGAQVPAEFRKFMRGNRLDIINGQALELPNHELDKLARYPEVFRVHYDRPINSQNYRTAVTVGARNVVNKYGYTGAGIGVAVIDSGITSWHDDLINDTSKTFPYGNQRVAKFVDFVNGRATPYDDNGHGTHVAGTIAGLGYDSNHFEKAGIAPLASLVSLKVLDQNGRGSVSKLIAALNWVAQNHKTYNIRVVNMSVGAGVYESYWTDPLTLAAKAVTDKGVTVVAAAGNKGKNAAGELQWGGITAPGNAPWVLTVGASSTKGTTSRGDDEMAGYSSSGPTAFDFAAKPDLVAPGTGTVSLLSAGSLFAATKSQFIVNGRNGQPVYLALSGTSMAAPVVSGTVALMMQANPNLTPNLVKAILQYTAEPHPEYSPLRDGAGFLNTLGAVDLARFYATASPGAKMKVPGSWSRSIIWGNHRLSKGDINPTANAWGTNIVWGTAKTLMTSGDNIVWGTMAQFADNIVWGTSTTSGGLLGSALNMLDNIVWGTSGLLDNIVWGTAFDTIDNIVWGTDCGGADCDNIVWGTADALDNIVWGTCDLFDNIVWGTSGLENIVWSTSTDDMWGSSGDETVVYPDEATEPLPGTVLDFSNPALLPWIDLTTGSISGGGL
jgi:serine protease AprX